jgi:hypothetical protein
MAPGGLVGVRFERRGCRLINLPEMKANNNIRRNTGRMRPYLEPIQPNLSMTGAR